MTPCNFQEKRPPIYRSYKKNTLSLLVLVLVLVLCLLLCVKFLQLSDAWTRSFIHHSSVGVNPVNGLTKLVFHQLTFPFPLQIVDDAVNSGAKLPHLVQYQSAGLAGRLRL